MTEENLGTAVLKIVVDDEPARNALNLLKRDVEATTRQADRTRRTATTRTTAKGGAREATDAVERANQRIIGVQNRINLLEAKGVDITQLRARLSQAIAANEQRNFGSVKQITAQLSNSLKIEEGRLRVSAAQTAELKRQQQVAPKERVTSQKPTGVGFATTPEQILASRGGTQKGAATNIDTLNTALDKTVQLRNRLNILQAKGVNISSLVATYEQAVTAAKQGQLGTSQQLLRNLGRQVSLQENDLRVTNLKEAAEKRRLRDATAAERKTRAATRRTGTGTGTTVTTSKAASFEDRLAAARTRATRAAEKETQQRQKATQGRIASGLIGGGFPLLFGQGGGAAAGGLLGGLIGGGPFGFGASIVGTLLGSQIDLLNQRFGELANALEDPIASFDVFIQKATLASKAQESLAKALQEAGQNAAAADLIQREASRTIDPISAQGAVIAQDDFNRALSNTQDVLGSIVSGPATGFLNFLTSTLEILGGAPQQGTTNPITTSIEGANKAANKLGLNIGGILAGVTLTAAGLATTFATGGAGAAFGVPLIGAGLTTAGLGAAGAGAAQGDTRVAISEAVLTAELAVAAAKDRQVALEREILQARASGKKGLDEQISLRAQFNALQIEELQGLSRIQQELARKEDGFNDLEDQAAAIRQEKELRAAIELRRQALLAAASAAQTASVTELKNARQLVGKYGAEREILSTQLKIKSAVDAAYQAQLQLNKARKEGASTAEIQAAEKIVNTLINERILTELEGTELIRKLRQDISTQIQFDNTVSGIKLESINKQIAATQALGNAEEGVARSTLATVQNIQAGIDAAKDRERVIGAQIDIARQRDAEPQEINELVKQQKIASAETKLSLVEGAQALRDAGAQLVKDGQQVSRNLQNLRESNLRFQTPEERQRTISQLNREVQAEANRRGVNITFRGSTEQILSEKRAFVDFGREERQLIGQQGSIQQAIEFANQGLVSINTELTKSNTDLAAAIIALSKKDWSVYINNNYTGSAAKELLSAATLP